MTWHLSSRHNMECEHTIPMGLHTACPFITATWHRDSAHHGYLSPCHNAGCGHTTTWDCVPHRNLLPNYGIDVSCNMGIYRHTIIWDVEMPLREIAPQIARTCARKGAGWVTPKGLYRRKGRVDERSEIYPV